MSDPGPVGDAGGPEVPTGGGPTPGDPQGPGPAWRAVDWLLRDRVTGRWVVAQWPNLSIGLWIGATVVRRVADPAGAARTGLVVVGTGALLWWATDELARGVNPWRRLLGGAVLATVVAGLARRLVW